MSKIERRITIDFHWTRVDGRNIHDEHVEALEESAWERVVEMAGKGYNSGILNAYVRATDADPEDGVHYSGWWTLNGGQPNTNPRVLVVVEGGVADPVYDPGVDVEVFDWDNHEVDPEETAPVPAHFRDLAEPLGIPVED